MSFSTFEISAVRALPLVLAVDAAGRWQTEPGFAAVTFTSSAAGKYHQAYVDGRWAGATLSTAERSLIVPAPEGAASVIEVIAVDPADRLRDFSADLAGYADAQGSRLRVAWSGGRYLGDALDHFDVYGGPAGAVDRTRPLNAEPLAPLVNGTNRGGWGAGGFGRGGCGRSAMTFIFVTAKNFAGRYAVEVVAVDSADNPSPADAVTVELAGPPRPPADLAVAAYDAATRTARLAWSPSPDLP